MTISYAPPPAASAPVPAGDAAPAADSPLGFLAALIGQLVGQTAPPPADSAAIPFGNTSGLVMTPAAGAGATPPGSQLLASLADVLAALQAALDQGGPPGPDQIKEATDAADAIAGLLNLPSLTPSAGAETPPSDGVAPIGAATPSTPPALPALAALAAKLTDLGQSLTTASPELAQKLAALGTAIAAAEADPSLLAPLTTAADTSGAKLDAVVQKVLDTKLAKTPPAPQIAANVELALPSVISRPNSDDSDARALNAAQVARDIETAATPNLKVTAAIKTPDAGDKPPQPKSDTLPVFAASVGPDTSDPAAPASSAAATTAQPTPVARIIQTAYQPLTAPASVAPQVAFEMVRQFQQGLSRFTIRLDPPELGRIDVKMHVDAAGAVNARLTVERAETLDLFQRDQRSLERALTQAGLDGNKTNLEFSLKQNPFAGMQGQGRNSGDGFSPGFRTAMSADDDSVVPSITLYRGAASAGGINLFV